MGATLEWQRPERWLTVPRSDEAAYEGWFDRELVMEASSQETALVRDLEAYLDQVRRPGDGRDWLVLQRQESDSILAVGWIRGIEGEAAAAVYDAQTGDRGPAGRAGRPDRRYLRQWDLNDGTRAALVAEVRALAADRDGTRLLVAKCTGVAWHPDAAAAAHVEIALRDLRHLPRVMAETNDLVSSARFITNGAA